MDKEMRISTKESVDEVDHVRIFPSSDIDASSRLNPLKKPTTAAVMPGNHSDEQTGKRRGMLDSKRYFGRRLRDSCSNLARCKSSASETLLMAASPMMACGLGTTVDILGNIDRPLDEIRKKAYNHTKKKKKVPMITLVPVNYRDASQSKCEELPPLRKIKSKQLKQILNSQCRSYDNSKDMNVRQFMPIDIDAMVPLGIGRLIEACNPSISNFMVEDFQTNISLMSDLQAQKWMNPRCISVAKISKPAKIEQEEQVVSTEEMPAETDFNPPKPEEQILPISPTPNNAISTPKAPEINSSANSSAKAEKNDDDEEVDHDILELCVDSNEFD